MFFQEGKLMSDEGNIFLKWMPDRVRHDSEIFDHDF